MAEAFPSWAIPAAKAAYEHRAEIGRRLQAIRRRLFGRKIRIAFTGMTGAGKTVLFDYLSGKAYKQGYLPPCQSDKPESGELPGKHRGMLVTVVPGQDFGPRNETLERLFGGKKPVDGVVHVVSNGFPQTRSQWGLRVLAEEARIKTLGSYRRYQRRQEIADLERTCALIRPAVRKYRKPEWMVVAVTKMDLYPAEIAEAERRYCSPHGRSRFLQCMRRFMNQVGSDNFRWTAAQACSWLGDFEGIGEPIRSQLRPEQRDQMLTSFTEILESYCGD